MLEREASKARTAIRGLIAFYLGLPNYRQSLRLMASNDSGLPDGSASNFRAIGAWGNEQRSAIG